MLVGILLFPLIALIVMVAVLDALQIRRSSFHPLEPSYQILQYGIILLTLVVCFRLIRGFRVKGVARRLAWIALSAAI